jgi:hypothetical protein
VAWNVFEFIFFDNCKHEVLLTCQRLVDIASGYFWEGVESLSIDPVVQAGIHCFQTLSK